MIRLVCSSLHVVVVDVRRLEANALLVMITYLYLFEKYFMYNNKIYIVERQDRVKTCSF